MGRPSKRAKKIRKGDEFDLGRLQAQLKPPTQSSSAYSWTLAQIRAARDEQLRGVFKTPAQMAESMRTDDALFPPYQNRLAPQRSLGVELVPAPGDKGKRVALEAEALFGAQGIGVRPSTLESINGTLADHGVAFGVLHHRVRDDGTRVDVELRSWPIRWVQHDPLLRGFRTQVEFDDDSLTEAEAVGLSPGAQVPIVHGDGRWVVFCSRDEDPWKHRACLLPAALVWARHAFAARDWAKGSTAHGNAKVVGELPEGIDLGDGNGALTEQAQAFLELLQAIASVDSPAGIRPAGSKTDFLTNTSTAWQVWKELMMNAEKAAARIYLGTDGMLGSVGGAPGVDIATLFGIATTIVQSDLATMEDAIFTGVIEPWCAINFGDSRLAPRRRFLMPDPDAEQERANFAKRLDLMHAALERHKKNGLEVTQAFVNDLADKFDVPRPTLPTDEDRAPSIALAPTDLARVVRVNEARASAGLGPLLKQDGTPDPDGLLSVGEFSAKLEAKSKGATDAGTTTPSNGARPTNGAGASA